MFNYPGLFCYFFLPSVECNSHSTFMTVLTVDFDVKRDDYTGAISKYAHQIKAKKPPNSSAVIQEDMLLSGLSAPKSFRFTFSPIRAVFSWSFTVALSLSLVLVLFLSLCLFSRFLRVLSLALSISLSTVSPLSPSPAQSRLLSIPCQF